MSVIRGNHLLEESSNSSRGSSPDIQLGESLLDPPHTARIPRCYHSPSRSGSPSRETPDHIIGRPRHYSVSDIRVSDQRTQKQSQGDLFTLGMPHNLPQNPMAWTQSRYPVNSHGSSPSSSTAVPKMLHPNHYHRSHLQELSSDSYKNGTAPSGDGVAFVQKQHGFDYFNASSNHNTHQNGLSNSRISDDSCASEHNFGDHSSGSSLNNHIHRNCLPKKSKFSFGNGILDLSQQQNYGEYSNCTSSNYFFHEKKLDRNGVSSVSSTVNTSKQQEVSSMSTSNSNEQKNSFHRHGTAPSSNVVNDGVENSSYSIKESIQNLRNIHMTENGSSNIDHRLQPTIFSNGDNISNSSTARSFMEPEKGFAYAASTSCVSPPLSLSPPSSSPPLHSPYLADRAYLRLDLSSVSSREARELYANENILPPDEWSPRSQDLLLQHIGGGGTKRKVDTWDESTTNSSNKGRRKDHYCLVKRKLVSKMIRVFCSVGDTFLLIVSWMNSPKLESLYSQL